MSDDIVTDKAAKPSVAQMFKALADMFKSIPSDKLDGIRDVEDLFNGPGHSKEHSIPGREELGPFGPAEPMSGRGASKMVREYSDLAPQTGMTELYARLENYMGHMGKSVSALAGTVGDVLKNQRAVAEMLDGFVKAETEREVAAKKAEAPVFGDDTYTGNALKRLDKARKAFRKSDFADEAEIEIRRGLLEEAQTSLKSAKALLSKAEDAAEDMTGETTEKALADVRSLQDKVTKSLADIQKADDKDDEDRKEKEAEDAKKAETPVVEAAKAEPEAPVVEEKKADEPVADMQQAIKAMQDAAEGNSMMQATIKDFIELLSKSSRGMLPPNFQVVKAGPAGADAVEGRIAAAKDVGGILTMSDGILADSLLNRQRAAEAGRYSKERFDDDLMKAPETVRKLFAA